nr:hypothetical protein [Mucilaginibacter sp. X4EP1]
MHRDCKKLIVSNRHYPAHGRGGLVTFVATKVTKKSSQQKGFLALRAFTLQIRQNLGCNLFAVIPYH